MKPEPLQEIYPHPQRLPVLLACLIALTLGLVHSQSVVAATALGSAFTYQGRLLVSLAPPNTPYDFQFTLFDSSAGGIQIAAPITLVGVPVNNGLFTVQLDFGSAAFQGDNRFVSIGVRTNGSTG